MSVGSVFSVSTVLAVFAYDATEVNARSVGEGKHQFSVGVDIYIGNADAVGTVLSVLTVLAVLPVHTVLTVGSVFTVSAYNNSEIGGGAVRVCNDQLAVCVYFKGSNAYAVLTVGTVYTVSTVFSVFSVLSIRAVRAVFTVGTHNAAEIYACSVGI